VAPGIVAGGDHGAAAAGAATVTAVTMATTEQSARMPLERVAAARVPGKDRPVPRAAIE